MFKTYFRIFSIELVYGIIVFSLFVYSLLLFCTNAEEHFIGISNEDDKTFEDKLFNRTYFAILLATTNGYDNEIRPRSKKCRIIVTGFLLFLFFLFFGILNMLAKHDNYSLE